METVLVIGGTGLIGRHLCEKLRKKGYNVTILSRTRKQENETYIYSWDLDKKEIEKEAIETADYIINLAGTNISGKRWTSKRKQLIVDSRVKTGELIFNKIKKQNKKLKAYISASAIGYYGTTTSQKIFTETDPPANDFLGEACRQWEQTNDQFIELGIRTVKIRTSIVLTKQGGALAKMATPIKLGIGSSIGSGKQYLPWIHIDDLCGIYIKAITDDQIEGVFNAVAPDHKTNEEFTQTLANTLKKTIWAPKIPAIVLKLIFGEMSDILLKGSRISNQKIKEAGYTFLFPNLKSALTNLFKK
jgi:hypothetical protein